MTQTPDRPQPDEEFIIHDLETLKVLADSLRMQILDLLREKPLTVKQMAGDLDITATKLYYHINLMEKHGLIRVIDTRIVSGILEKRYQASARTYRLDQRLLSPAAPTGDESIEMMFATVFDDTKLDIKKSIRVGLVELAQPDADPNNPNPHGLVLTRMLSRLTPEQAAEFYRRLNDLAREFAAHRTEPDNADQQVYSLIVAAYPSTRVPLHPHHTEEISAIPGDTDASRE